MHKTLLLLNNQLRFATIWCALCSGTAYTNIQSACLKVWANNTYSGSKIEMSSRIANIKRTPVHKTVFPTTLFEWGGACWRVRRLVCLQSSMRALTWVQWLAWRSALHSAFLAHSKLSTYYLDYCNKMRLNLSPLIALHIVNVFNSVSLRTANFT